MEKSQVIICGGPDKSLELRQAIESGKEIILDSETSEILAEIKQHEQRKSGFNTLSMMAQMFGNVYGMGSRHHSTPHYFEYSGIPSEEQLRKRAERKARKMAKKLAK